MITRKKRKQLRKLKQVKVSDKLIWQLTRVVTKIVNPNAGKHFYCPICLCRGCVGFDGIIVYCNNCRYKNEFNTCLRLELEKPMTLICCQEAIMIKICFYCGKVLPKGNKNPPQGKQTKYEGTCNSCYDKLIDDIYGRRVFKLNVNAKIR